MKLRLTTRSIEALRPPAKGQLDIYDAGGPPGFLMRVSQGGTRTFQMLYRVEGKLKRWTIGRFPSVSLAEAREKAKRRDALHEDPVGRMVELKRAATFGELAEQFLEAEGPKLKERTLVEWRRIIQNELLDAFGAMKVHEIGRGDIRTFLDTKAKTAPVMANRILEVIRRVLSWGLDVEKIQASPAAGLKKPGVEKSRERVLTNEEIRRVFEALEEERPLSAAFFKIAFLTAARRGEVLGAKWSDLDLGEKLWTIPDTKAGRSHAVPLTEEAVAIFRSLHPFSGNSEFVFLGPTGGPVQSPQKAVARLRKRTGIDFRVHDIRRTVATGIARLGVPRETISAILNHVSGGPSATRVYDRHSRIPEMRAALTRWAAELERIRTGAEAKVVPLGR